MTLDQIYCPPIPESWIRPARVIYEEGKLVVEELPRDPKLSYEPHNIKNRAYRRDNKDRINARRRKRYAKKAAVRTMVAMGEECAS